MEAKRESDGNQAENHDRNQTTWNGTQARNFGNKLYSIRLMGFIQVTALLGLIGIQQNSFCRIWGGGLKMNPKPMVAPYGRCGGHSLHSLCFSRVLELTRPLHVAKPP